MFLNLQLSPNLVFIFFSVFRIMIIHAIVSFYSFSFCIDLRVALYICCNPKLQKYRGTIFSLNFQGIRARFLLKVILLFRSQVLYIYIFFSGTIRLLVGGFDVWSQQGGECWRFFIAGINTSISSLTSWHQ